MACITEEGRILEFSHWYAGGDILELVDGRWVQAVAPVSSDDEFHARTLSEFELDQMLKSGKSS